MHKVAVRGVVAVSGATTSTPHLTDYLIPVARTARIGSRGTVRVLQELYGWVMASRKCSDGSVK
ncbi:hypothetical protein J2S53_002231 [Actinopolyspora lacussalsi]|nr:hypothetical protein [Actinopolyspora lacussalsi]